MIITTYPSLDTLLRLFSARTPRYLTELFYCYRAAVKKDVKLREDEEDEDLRVVVNGKPDYGYEDMQFIKRFVEWEPPHSLVWLGDDVVGVTTYRKEIMMRFNIATRKWMHPFKLPAKGRVLGAAQWDKVPQFLYVYYCSVHFVEYVKLDINSLAVVARKRWSHPCVYESLHLVVMDFPRVLIHLDSSEWNRRCAWIITPDSMEPAIEMTVTAKDMMVEYVRENIVEISASVKIQSPVGPRYESYIAHYDVKEMKPTEIKL